MERTGPRPGFGDLPHTLWCPVMWPHEDARRPEDASAAAAAAAAGRGFPPPVCASPSVTNVPPPPVGSERARPGAR
jgi:hypothetical protein